MYNIYIYIYIQGFPYWGDGGSPPPPAKNLLIPPLKKSIQPNKKIKTSFLVIVIPPVPFLF